MGMNNENIDVVHQQQLEDHSSEEKQGELNDDEVVLGMTPFGPSDSNVRGNRQRRRRGRFGGDRHAKRQRIDRVR